MLFWQLIPQADRIRSFLQNRLAKIIADETPLRLSMQQRLVLHIVPLNSFLNKKRIDFSDQHNLRLNFIPIAVSYWDHRYNLDGFLTFRTDRNTGICDSYCQIFFDGTIEAYLRAFSRPTRWNSPKGLYIFHSE